jgi:hypothetical protein
MSKSYDLPCYDSRKSFYGKATVTEHDGKVPSLTLTSYNTNICAYFPATQELIKLDPVATATTRRHIRSFLRHVGLVALDNRAWDALPLKTYLRLTPEGWKPSTTY